MDALSVKEISRRLATAGIATDREAGSLARWIWEDMLGKRNFSEVQLTNEEVVQLEDCFYRLKKGEPIQYIVGHAWFYGWKFRVNPDVLIPRPETEELVHWVHSDFQEKISGIRMLDIGTGSGCIAIALKKKLPEATVVAIDISPEALATARSNADDLSVEIDFRLHDLLTDGFSGLGKFDVIISNPPYIDQRHAPPDVLTKLEAEPAHALFPPGDDPDIFYRRIAQNAPAALQPNGAVYLELNEFRVDQIVSCFADAVWKSIDTKTDLQGFTRMLRATM